MLLTKVKLQVIVALGGIAGTDTSIKTTGTSHIISCTRGPILQFQLHTHHRGNVQHTLRFVPGSRSCCKPHQLWQGMKEAAPALCNSAPFVSFRVAASRIAKTKVYIPTMTTLNQYSQVTSQGFVCDKIFGRFSVSSRPHRYLHSRTSSVLNSN